MKSQELTIIAKALVGNKAEVRKKHAPDSFLCVAFKIQSVCIDQCSGIMCNQCPIHKTLKELSMIEALAWAINYLKDTKPAEQEDKEIPTLYEGAVFKLYKEVTE